MAPEEEFTTDESVCPPLTGFGLSEKEAQLYLHLLKYGHKTPPPLVKALKTYREDVHCTQSRRSENLEDLEYSFGGCK